MSRRNLDHGRYWLNVRLDPELDADLIAWLQGQARGRRSEAVREALRMGMLTEQPRDSRIDLDDLRLVLADELAKALAGQPFTSPPVNNPPAENDLEAKYGARLDKLLGGLTTSHSDTDEGNSPPQV
jgi:Arc/MetJ-type ribon-helix-helix transcriptional regulator